MRHFQRLTFIQMSPIYHSSYLPSISYILITIKIAIIQSVAGLYLLCIVLHAPYVDLVKRKQICQFTYLLFSNIPDVHLYKMLSYLRLGLAYLQLYLKRKHVNNVLILEHDTINFPCRLSYKRSRDVSPSGWEGPNCWQKLDIDWISSFLRWFRRYISRNCHEIYRKISKLGVWNPQFVVL